MAHIRHTYNVSPTAEDQHIYQIASDTDRIIITQDEGFKKRIKQNRAGVIIIPPYLSNEEIDKFLVAFIRGKNPEDYRGSITKL